MNYNNKIKPQSFNSRLDTRSLIPVSDLKLDYELKVGGFNFLPNTSFKTVLNRIIANLGSSSGLPTLGTANQMLRVNSGGTALEYFTASLGDGIYGGSGVISGPVTNALLSPSAIFTIDWSNNNTSALAIEDGQFLFLSSPDSTTYLNISDAQVEISSLTNNFYISELYSVFMNSKVGIGISTPATKFHLQDLTATLNNVTEIQRTSLTAAGNASVGFGVKSLVQLDNDISNLVDAFEQNIYWLDAGATTEDAGYSLTLKRAGVMTTSFTLDHNGAITLPATGGLKIASNAYINSTTAGIITITNFTSSDFSRLNFGGNTSSFPSLKRSSAALIVRLADDSAHANLECAQLNTTGSIVANGGSNISWNARSAMSSPSNGVIRISNAAENDFSYLQLGGATTSYPAIKRDAATVAVRLADDSDYTDIKAKDLISDIAGGGIKIKEGSNARMGVATLVAGTVTVANTSVTAATRIFVTNGGINGTAGFLGISTTVPGTSFTITSSSATDTSKVNWLLIEPA